MYTNAMNYKHTTQTPNILFDHFLKSISFSELKILLTIIRKTDGQVDSIDSNRRVERAWISQRLFMICCNLSGGAVSTAIDSLVQKQLIEVSDSKGSILLSKSTRRGASQLFYKSLLRLCLSKEKACEHRSINPMKKGHTIKLNNIKQSCYNGSQGVQPLGTTERFIQLQAILDIRNNQDTH